VGKQDDKATKNIVEKIKKFISGENLTQLTYTFDIYTEKENFIAIQGIKTEAYARNVASILKEDKKFKITEPAIVISSDNYKVVQIKKNLEEYLSPPKTVVVPNQPAVPNPVVPQPAVDKVKTQGRETQTKATPPPSKASRTRPPGGTSTIEGNDNPNPSSTPKQ
jgi:hypothetical protein